MTEGQSSAAGIRGTDIPALDREKPRLFSGNRRHRWLRKDPGFPPGDLGDRSGSHGPGLFPGLPALPAGISHLPAGLGRAHPAVAQGASPETETFCPLFRPNCFPLTYGVLRPVILLPKKAGWDSEEQLSYILLHEYVHVRRFDAAFKLLLPWPCASTGSVPPSG